MPRHNTSINVLQGIDITEEDRNEMIDDKYFEFILKMDLNYSHKSLTNLNGEN